MKTSTTLLLPTGTKVRTASKRRFVVVAEYVDGTGAIVRRSDNLDTAKAAAYKAGLGTGDAHLFDTVTTPVKRYDATTRTWVVA